MSSIMDFRTRIEEILKKYNCKPLSPAAIEALAMAMDRMVENRTRSCLVPHLGLATTGEILDELRVRIEIHATGGLEYRTVNRRPQVDT